MHTASRKRGEINWSENFPNLMKTFIYTWEEPQLTLSKLNEKKFTLRHIIIKLFEVKKKKNLESSKRSDLSSTKDHKENQLICFSSEIIEVLSNGMIYSMR